jgi:protein SCO1/2
MENGRNWLRRKPIWPRTDLRWGSVLLALWLAVTLGASGKATTQAGIEVPFELVDVSGHAVTDRDFRGRWLLVYFGYTFCPDICPTTVNEIVSVIETLGTTTSRLQPVFISLDPTRDTPEALKEYLRSFGPEILGLTGTDEQVARAASAFDVVFFKVPDDTPSRYTIAHSGFIYVVGPEGGLVTRFPADAGTGRIIATLRTLLQ